MRRHGFGIFAASRAVYTLWLGRDHLLLVERGGFTENYKRFYFTDIQAVIQRRTSSAAIVSAVSGTLALGFFAWALSVSNLPGRVTLWIVGGLCAMFCAFELWRGPTCVTHIQTAVQTEQIPSWGRIRAARKCLAEIRPRLEEAQGAIPADVLKAQWLEGLRGGAQTPAPNPT
jgi:hypothetical protein